MGTFNVLEAVAAYSVGHGAGDHHDRQGLPKRQPGGRICRVRCPRRTRPVQRLQGDGRPAHAIVDGKLSRLSHRHCPRGKRHRWWRREHRPPAARSAPRILDRPHRRDPVPGCGAPMAARARLPQRLRHARRRAYWPATVPGSGTSGPARTASSPWVRWPIWRPACGATQPRGRRHRATTHTRPCCWHWTRRRRAPSSVGATDSRSSSHWSGRSSGPRASVTARMHEMSACSSCQPSRRGVTHDDKQ